MASEYLLNACKEHSPLRALDGRAASTHAKKIWPPQESSKKSLTPPFFSRKSLTPPVFRPPGHLNFDPSLSVAVLVSGSDAAPASPVLCAGEFFKVSSNQLCFSPKWTLFLLISYVFIMLCRWEFNPASVPGLEALSWDTFVTPINVLCKISDPTHFFAKSLTPENNWTTPLS